MTNYISDKDTDYSGWTRIENPKGLPVEKLPRIYVFINGWMAGPVGQALAEDGMPLGSHACSEEAWIYYDMGIAEGRRPDRHETYLKHYPNGYVLEYIPDFAIKGHKKLQQAFKNNARLAEEKAHDD